MSRSAVQLWRDAATLMIIGRNTKSKTPFSYRFLLLQRSSKSRFMPSRYVFPGGTIERADSSDEWMKLYEKSFDLLGFDFTSLLEMKEPRPPIFRKSSTLVPSEVAFRICAIRETFEESGVLLLKNISTTRRIAPSSGTAEVYNNLSDLEIREWRDAVHNDPSNFINLCRYLQCVPDVWALGEWSNWLTPADMKIRFDTAFFICFVDHEPTAQHDDKETTHSQWKTPVEAVMDYFSKKSMIAPPQLYTFLQLSRMTKWEELKAFQERRAKLGCERWLAIRIKCSNGSISVLPGDDMYPAVLHHVAQATNGEYGVRSGVIPSQEFTETIEELQENVKNLHRITHKPQGNYELLANCSFPNGLCSPLTDISELLKRSCTEYGGSKPKL